ncbi:MAG TPA: CHAT domain-containing protein, partial [Saprospiraceae bacterium]|nr:CHAT domain-containing protein [Saprospiraceae bacterium]
WYRKKDFPQAVANAEKALTILETRCPDQYLLKIQIYLDLDNAYLEAQTYDKALAYLQKAMQVHEQHHIDEQIEITWYNLGYVYAMMGRYPQATAYLKRAIERYDPKHPNFGKACRYMGFVFQRQGNLRGALAWQQKALQALTDSFPYQDILANPAVQRVNSYSDFLFALREKAETLHQLAKKEQKPQFLEASLATYDVAMGLLDTMRAEYQEGSRQFWNREARPIVEGAIGTALEMSQNTGDVKYLEQAFRYAEKSKALLLAEALRESAAKQKAGIPDELLQKEKDLKIDIAFYKRQIFREQQKTAADTSKILLWQKEVLDRRRAYEALLTELEKSYPAYYQIKYSQPLLNITAVQQAMPPNNGLIEYFSGDSATYVFYIDRNSARGVQMKADVGFSDQLESFFNNLRNRNQVLEQGRSQNAIAQYAKVAAALYSSLIAPVSQKIPGQLIIIPDGNLSYLPFELLLTNDPGKTDNYTNLPYLLKEAAVRYEYSASLALQPPVDKNPQSRFIGYAPGYTKEQPVTTRGDHNVCRETDAADFAALGNNQMEVLQIARLLGGKALLGDLATETHFKQHAAEPRILHFAMHGFLNDCDPLYSGLVFSRPGDVAGRDANNGNMLQDSIHEDTDGFLHTYEIYNLRLNADLAVLSACNTGRGQLAKGEGVISLARAFKYAGCSNVLMSLWQADDQATAQIMQGFYRYLKEGKGKDTSIRQAKLDYLSAGNRNHPFFWGAFVLIGDDRPLEQPSNRIWYGVGILLLAGAAFVYWPIKRFKQGAE